MKYLCGQCNKKKAASQFYLPQRGRTVSYVCKACRKKLNVDRWIILGPDYQFKRNWTHKTQGQIEKKIDEMTRRIKILSDIKVNLMCRHYYKKDM